jgi:hypothetical protein
MPEKKEKYTNDRQELCIPLFILLTWNPEVPLALAGHGPGYSG